MATHARFSPSASKRWLSCPGSLVLNAGREDSGPSPYADKGTAMHAVAAWCLTEHYRASKRVGDQIPVHKDGEEPRHVEFTDDMATDTQEYVDWLRSFAIGKVLHVEQQVDFSGVVGQPDQFGTADAIVWDAESGELTIVDLKTGFRPVDAAGNTQLMTYALGALLQLAAAGTSQPAQAEEQHAVWQPPVWTEQEKADCKVAFQTAFGGHQAAQAEEQQQEAGDDDLF